MPFFKCLQVWTLLSMCMKLSCSGKGTLLEVSEANIPTVLKEKKCAILYAEQSDCERCKLLYHVFLVTAQNFRNDKTVFFGKVADEMLLRAFDVTSFPGIVYYEFGRVIPKVYLGDITSGALTKVVLDAMKGDFRKFDRQFSLILTKENFDEVMETEQHYRLVMLHETDDEDEIDMYEEIAETFENEPDVIIARINVDFEKKLKRKYTTVEYPSFYWYSKGNISGKKRYGGTLNVGQMIAFINKEAGLFRTKGGRLNPYAGLIQPFDQIINRYGKELYEIRRFDIIRFDLKKASKTLDSRTDHELMKFYFELLDELEEDKTIEALDETRNRLYRRMDDVGPLEFDQLIRKRNIVQKFIDIIGYHLLQELSDEHFGNNNNEPETYDINDQGLEFHEEL